MTQSIEKIIPLSEQPAYQAAIGKVVEIGRALALTNAQLAQRREEFVAAQNRIVEAPGLIDRALAVASGEPLIANPPVATTTSEIMQLNEERKVLEDGLKEANSAADLVSRSLARAVGMQLKDRHVESAKRVLECLEALCLANIEESNIREGLEKIGYYSHGLPSFTFDAPGRTNDSTGSPAYYFAGDVKSYVSKK